MVLWVSQFPFEHGSLGIFRSLGRAGVRVYTVVGRRCAAAASSRYVKGRILWQPQHGDSEELLLERLLEFGRRLGRRSLIICTGDEMALFAAKHRDVLSECFILPAVDPDLPATLVDKRGLDRLCSEYGVPVPKTEFVHSKGPDVTAVVDTMDPPFVVKSSGPRGPGRQLENTVVLPDRESVFKLVRTLDEPLDLTIQEYLPDEGAEDWFTVGYCDADAATKIVFTGRKARAWPVRGGAASAGFTAVNTQLAQRAAAFCKDVGYRGVFDMDWRRDQHTGTFKLLDFNPRPGAQFRMFENDAGVDVVRAMHLDMSGRPIPDGTQIEGERFIIEPWELANWMATRHGPREDLGGTGRPRLAWVSADDPVPTLLAMASQIGLSIKARLPFRSA